MKVSRKTTSQPGSPGGGEDFVKSELDRLRHSASHIMAQAMKDLYPGVKLAIGPAIENGFYYDFDLPDALTEEDLPRIEARMREIIREDQRFEQRFVAKQEALALFEKQGEIYKTEIIRGIPDEQVSIYQNGLFLDLCRGPHVGSTGEVKAVKLLSVAGAYWRGDERNKMLRRIYGTAFGSQKDLDEHLARVEEAKRRDHRKLGRELDLFSFHDEAPAMPFFHERGMVLYQSVLDYWREEHAREGYIEVKTPMILRDELWKQSGHYDHYKDHMYFTKIEDESFAVKPMNCPGGTLIYRAHPHSYRDLPIRMAELGLVHRHELSGVLHGLFRVKAFTIDDAHVFCTEEQIESEISRCLDLIFRVYKTFGFGDVAVALSTRPKDSMGTDEIWEKATRGLRNALEHNKVSYCVQEGGGAFYGPKIDLQIRDCLARLWQCGTIQLDFSMPERFNLTYVASDGKERRPVMIHRAILGSVERFLGILIEHYGGAFPAWLSPCQVKVLSISEKQAAYAKRVAGELQAAGIRAEADLRDDKITAKVRDAEMLKVPYMAVVGAREEESLSVSLRARGRKDLGVLAVGVLVETLRAEIRQRA